MMNNTVYFNREWMEALECLSEESRNKIIGAIITYQVTGKTPELDADMAIFVLLKLEVDRRNRRLADAREKRAAKKTQKKTDGENVEADAPAAPDASKNEPEPSKSADKNPPKPVPSATKSAPEPPAVKPPRPELSPEKKAAIAALISALQQPRPNQKR